MKIITDKQLYLDRMSKSLQEKLKIINFFPEGTKDVLDVGCADGTISIALAQLFPEMNFLGIDLNEEFIGLARGKSKEVKNVRFEKIYLRQLLARTQKFDLVIFCSVLHEFFSYGEGISSVLKALADAHELLKTEGVIVIRDMILNSFVKESHLFCEEINKKIVKRKDLELFVRDFEERFGKLKNIYRLNHFLLKYLYTENWERESRENYVPVTFEEYEQIFALLGMKLQQKDLYLIPFLKEKWQKDFGLTEKEISIFKSTGIIVARKK